MQYHGAGEEPWVKFGATENEWEDWKWQAKNGIRDMNSLSRIEGFHMTDGQTEMLGMFGNWPMRITPYYASLMGDNPTGVGPDGKSITDDVNPIFLQAVPTPDRYLFRSGMPDPMSEGSRSVGASYQRYVDRVALMSSPSAACHMYCTHCQRGKDLDGTPNMKNIGKGLRYIKDNKNIKEALVTGGDALALSENVLDFILSNLTETDHVESIRIASRLPVTNPFAVNSEKMDIISRYSKHATGNYNLPDIGVVTHSNSPDELTLDMQDAVSLMRRYGLDVRNQAVLLNGVNNDFASLSKLLKNLHFMGVRPYSLSQCHKVEGLSSKIVPINDGQYFMAELRGQMGSSIPKYMVNMTGGGGKVDLTPEGDTGMPDYGYRLSRRMRTWNNKIVNYEELMRVRESDYEKGMEVMSEFYGDPSIRDHSEHDLIDEFFYGEGGGFSYGKGDLRDLKVRTTASKKFRPSVIVVDDNNPERVLYVTNVGDHSPMGRNEKLGAMGYIPNGKELGHPNELYITNPGVLELAVYGSSVEVL